MKFSEKLYYLRTKENMSQEELASQLGVSRQAISKWEVGDTMPELGKIMEISEFFKISIDCLVKENLDIAKDNTVEKLVINFLNTAKDMNQISDDLIEIARDGIIDSEEKKQLAEIIKTLDSMVEIVEELKLRVNE